MSAGKHQLEGSHPACARKLSQVVCLITAQNWVSIDNCGEEIAHNGYRQDGLPRKSYPLVKSGLRPCQSSRNKEERKDSLTLLWQSPAGRASQPACITPFSLIHPRVISFLWNKLIYPFFESMLTIS